MKVTKQEAKNKEAAKMKAATTEATKKMRQRRWQLKY
jgi:hypothetical protein